MERRMKYFHPGIIIKDLIFEERGLHLADAAELLGVTRTAVSHLVNGKVDVSADMGLRLAAVFGGNAEYWLRMQATYHFDHTRPRINDLKLKRYKPKSKKFLPIETASADEYPIRGENIEFEHPGILLKEEILDEHNLSIANAAKLLGVTKAVLSDLINAKADLSAEMSLRIEKVFGGEAEFWQRIQAGFSIQEALPHITKLKLKRYRPKSKKPLPVKETKRRGRKVKSVV